MGGPKVRLNPVCEVRLLTKADLARLSEPRKQQTIKKLRDSHHYLARLFAAGMDMKEVAKRTGYPYSRILYIRRSPAFDQLVSEYRTHVNREWLDSLDDYMELSVSNMIRAELQIADKLGEAEEADETLPTRDLIAISRDAADRFGYGKKNTNVNINVDFAARLEQAIRRSGKQLDLPPFAGPQLEGQVVPVPTPVLEGPRPSGDDSGSPSGVVAPFRRRA